MGELDCDMKVCYTSETLFDHYTISIVSVLQVDTS